MLEKDDIILKLDDALTIINKMKNHVESLPDDVNKFNKQALQLLRTASNAVEEAMNYLDEN